ncbi:MAG: hypothetical protein HC939_00785 [Pleurocapsa sp. SU_5_0]|nr:hypothetical protein [Pleurocapsa sp. SU_5_0]NJO97645.1 hypothetical protein [Pleurocapsa sp. CRU_1_2]NJR44539.1 hypothetical protein [Hyellaceae cyanobacterium CSU_1_1]
MTSTKQTTAKPLTQEIFQALTNAMSETAQIEVTTYLDSWDLDHLEQSASTSRFYTQIDLLNQTVQHEVDLKLIDNSTYGELQRWHIEQVRRRQESLIKNLASLEQMRQMITNQDCT